MGDLTGAGKDRPTTLYLVVPWDKMDIQKTWLRLMISIGMHTFKRKPPGARYRCLFLIDEFPALGLLPGHAKGYCDHARGRMLTLLWWCSR